MRVVLVLLPLTLPLACAEKAAAPPTPATGAEPASESESDADADAEAEVESEAEPLAPVGRRKPPGAGKPESPLERAVKDRVLASLKDPASFDEARLKARFEEATGAKVVRIRKGPLGLLQVTFAPTSPPRDKEAQRALVRALDELDELKYAEPERVMEAKTEP